MNTSAPLISVIIPTYNRFIETSRAINSVFNQNYKNLEIIVVDDLSSNDSYQLLTEKYGSKVKFLQNKTNSGAATGRNYGVSEANGEFVAFLDSDDIWFSEKLGLQLSQHLEAEKTFNKVLTYSPAKLDYMVKGSFINPLRALGETEKIEEYIFISEQDVQTSGWFLRRSFFNEVKFTEFLRRHQDLDFLFRAQAIGCKFLMTSMPLYKRVAGNADQHVGTIRDDGITLKWMQSVKHLISPLAYHQFIYTKVYPMTLARSPVGAIKLIISAMLDKQPFLGKLKYIFEYWIFNKK